MKEVSVGATQRVLTPFFTQTNYDNFAFETLLYVLTGVKRILTHSRGDKTVYYDTSPESAR